MNRANRWKRQHGLVLSCHQPGSVVRSIASNDQNAPLIKALGQADRVVLLSEHFAGEYHTFCRPESLRVIPHGVDVDFFLPPASLPSTPLILTIGNWLRDYDFWAQIILELARQVPSATFAVVALPMFLGAAKERVEQALPDRCTILTDVSDEKLKALYQQATALFLPLKDAGANNALLEAMASGLPTIVTDLPATREYAGDCALYYKSGDTRDCLSKLRFVINDPQARTKLAESGRRRAEQRFDWRVIASLYSKLYSEVLAGPPSPSPSQTSVYKLQH